MGYDRDRWANPLRRLWSDIKADHELEPHDKKHLRLMVDDYLLLSDSIDQQEVYATGIFARWMKLKTQRKMRQAVPGTREFTQLQNSMYKQALITKSCLKIGGTGKNGSKRGTIPPTASKIAGRHAQDKSSV